MSARDRCPRRREGRADPGGIDDFHDPYRVTIGRRRGYIDLGAEMPLAAEKEGRRIAVEVKSFLGPSELDDLERALGQYGIYRVVLEKRNPQRLLYLALCRMICAPCCSTKWTSVTFCGLSRSG